MVCRLPAVETPMGADVASASGDVWMSTDGVVDDSISVEVSAVGQRFLNQTFLASLGGSLFVTATYGDFSTVGDALWTYDASSKVATHIVDAAAGGTAGLGGVVFDANSQTAFVTDADPKTPRVRVFKVQNGNLTEGTAITAGASTGLAPRSISPL